MSRRVDLSTGKERSGALPADLRNALGLISGSVTDAAASLWFLAALVRELGPLWEGVTELQQALAGIPSPGLTPEEAMAQPPAPPPPGLAAPGEEPAGALPDPRDESTPFPPSPASAGEAPLTAADRPRPAPGSAGGPSVLALTLRWSNGSVDMLGVHRALDGLSGVEQLLLAAHSSHSAHIQITAQEPLSTEEVERALARVFHGGLRREGSVTEGLVFTFEEGGEEVMP